MHSSVSFRAHSGDSDRKADPWLRSSDPDRPLAPATSAGSLLLTLGRRPAAQARQPVGVVTSPRLQRSSERCDTRQQREPANINATAQTGLGTGGRRRAEAHGGVRDEESRPFDRRSPTGRAGRPLRSPAGHLKRSRYVPVGRRRWPVSAGESRTGRERPLTALSQVRGRSSSVWRVKDSNLGSFRDGFTDGPRSLVYQHRRLVS
jgi:hypothetical protein